MAPKQDDTKPQSVKDVLDGVGDDPAKAQEALDTEKASSKPRKGLVTKLEKLAGDGPAELTEVDEDSDIDTLLAAAVERKIDVPDGVDPAVLLGVIRQVDAAAAASPDVEAQPVTEEYVEREAGYISPDYALAQEQGYLGVNPDAAPAGSHSVDSAVDGTNPPVNPVGGAVVQHGGV